MRIGHKIIVIADLCYLSPLDRPSMDSHILFEYVPVSDFDRCLFPFVSQILRFGPDTAEGRNMATLANFRLSVEIDMGTNPGSFSDRYFFADKRIRADFNPFSDPRLRMDGRC